MKSLLLREPGRAEVVEGDAPEPGPGEVVVRNEYVGICRTDRKCFGQGQRDLRTPRVLGHEMAGVVHAVGPWPARGAPPPALGTRVVVHPGLSCGTCPACRAGNDQVCPEMRIMGFHVDGGFSDFTRIPADGVARGVLMPVPDGLAAHRAALTEPLACAVNLEERLRFGASDSVLLIGAGVLGMLFAALARRAGVRRLVLVDLDPAKVEQARHAGYTAHGADTDDAGLLAGEAGFDVAIPCCPGTDALVRSVRLLARRGRLGVFSGLTSGVSISLAVIDAIHYRELAAFGSYGCGLRHGRRALSLLAEHPDLFNLPTRFIDLVEVPEVLAATETPALTTIDFTGASR